MEKLIFKFYYGDGYSYSGVTIVPFEYKSKEDFVYDALERFKKHDWKEVPYVSILNGCYLTKADLEDIESNILTLEDWFQQNNEKEIW